MIGRPFKWGGRGPDEFDCIGFVLWVYREAFGVTLPDPGAGKVSDRVRRLADLFAENVRPQTGDIAEVLDARHGPMQHHVCVVESDSWVAQCSQDLGVTRERKNTLWQPRYYRLRQ